MMSENFLNEIQALLTKKNEEFIGKTLSGTENLRREIKTAS